MASWGPRWIWILALSCASLLSCGGRKGTPIQQSAGPGAATAPGAPAAPAAPAPGPGVAPGPAPAGSAPGPHAWEPANRPSCPMDRLVREPAANTPEAVVSTLYAAARGPDTEEAFNTFARHFASQHQRDWIRKQYWPRIREHVGKYLESDNPVAFRICREDKKSDGTVKFFIRSYDPNKSDPPITLREEGGTWRVDFFTP